VWLLHPEALFDILLFTTGIVPSWLLGLLVLSRLPGKEKFADSPFAYRAMSETHPGLALLLFLSFLGLVGFPITPAFIGEDLLLYHASTQHAWIAALIAVSFVINGIAAARVFLRLCMGRPTEICDHAEITAIQAIFKSHN
jgi:NADH:ubiquinone oxidoreductase subunit 2 (subunit N)